MGILNVTPDSFSDGGRFAEAGDAIAAGYRMVADGAGMLDIGGESTRPGAQEVPADEEQRRVLPVIAGLRDAGVPLSIDTRHASTMDRALDAGATIVNDVSALTHDPAARALVATRGCPVILMHMRGTPATMKDHAIYGDVVAEVLEELQARIDEAVAAGIHRGRIAIDPGFGFAKTAEQNITLLRGLDSLGTLGPLIVGVSRKRFLGGQAPSASVAAGLFAWSRGARTLRVHDVAETVSALTIWQELCD